MASRFEPRRLLSVWLGLLLVALWLAFNALGYSSPLPQRLSDSSLDAWPRTETNCSSLIYHQQSVLISAFSKALAGHKHAAVLGGPWHENKGDSLVWIGQTILLKALGIDVVYWDKVVDFSKPRLEAAVAEYPDLVILFHGGGNFGDLYPHQTQRRSDVIRDFPNNAIRFFPQSIHFDDERNIPAVVDLIAAHKDIQVFVREHRSATFAEKHLTPLGIETHLVPDSAFMIGPRPDLRATEFANDVLFLHRLDIEATEEANRWVETSPSTWAASLKTVTKDWANKLYAPASSKGITFDRVAYERLLVCAEILNNGRFAVIDRLHGHILATLMGVPHVLNNNKVGKVAAYYETWTSTCPLGKLANSVDEAEDYAKSYFGL